MMWIPWADGSEPERDPADHLLTTIGRCTGDDAEHQCLDDAGSTSHSAVSMAIISFVMKNSQKYFRHSKNTWAKVNGQVEEYTADIMS